MDTTNTDIIDDKYIELHKKLIDSIHSIRLIQTPGSFYTPNLELNIGNTEERQHILNSIALYNNAKFTIYDTRDKELTESINTLTTENTVLKETTDRLGESIIALSAENTALKDRLARMETKIETLMSLLSLLK
jgi:hypothetical protein